MRWMIAGMLTTLCAACDEPTVERRIDTIRRSGVRFAHAVLLSPQRVRELSPDGAADLIHRHMREELMADANAAALLRAGHAAVPDLVRLLPDPERAAFAAFFLGEIGGKDAAVALLARWRELRGKDQEKHTYWYRSDGIHAGGYVYERIDDVAYREVIASLCYTGREVGSEIAKDTAAAMDESERLQRDGQKLSFEEWRDEDDGRLKRTWHAEPVETACEGLKLLAMAGAPEGVDLFVRALQSPVRAFRWEAIGYHSFLGKGRERTLPELGRLLDDPEWRAKAVEEIALVVAREGVPERMTEAQEEALVARYKHQLQELGHLPR